MTDTQHDIQAALDAGAALSMPRSPLLDGAIDILHGTPYAAVPEGFRVQSLEHLLAAPVRKRARVTTTDSPSFVAYLKKHGDAWASTIYATIDSEASKFFLVAVLDDHSQGAPQWREHVCSFAPKLSVEWVRWTSRNRQPMSQTDFATWLEDNLPDVATVDGMPTGAQILAMALGFEADADKKLRSKINLQSGGVQLEFVDEEKNDTRTTMQFFERFTLGIPVFDGSTSAYPVEARLKYREKSGVLTFWFELIRPDRVFKTAVNDELASIVEATDGQFLVVSGTPGL